MNYLFAIIIILTILSIYLVYKDFSRSYSYLNGFWIAPQSFLDESGASNIVFYFNTEENRLYSIIESDDDFLVNEDMDMSISYNPFSGYYNLYIKSMENDILPEYMNLEVDMKGKMIIYNDDEISAVLYKQCEYSDIL